MSIALKPSTSVTGVAVLFTIAYVNCSNSIFIAFISGMGGCIMAIDFLPLGVSISKEKSLVLSAVES
jgi:hypothetical protein